MAWYSILPAHLTIYETWIIRTFLFLAILNISPWLIAVVYDFLLWICRSFWFEVPVYGGRAQGRARPRAPSLKEARRRPSIAELITGGHTRTQSQEAVTELRRRDHERKQSNNAMEEE